MKRRALGTGKLGALCPRSATVHMVPQQVGSATLRGGRDVAQPCSVSAGSGAQTGIATDAASCLALSRSGVFAVAATAVERGSWPL